MNLRKRRRIAFAAALLIGGAGAAGLVAAALKDNVQYYFTPADVAAHRAPADAVFRIGGLVVKGSLRRGGDTIRFAVTDGKANLTVVYRGLPPALFAEGQGVVAIGRLNGDGVFAADRLLARHDEKYTPPEVTDALRNAGHLGDDGKRRAR
jgi:cytochrome c-type biogenesis protein CcmE